MEEKLLAILANLCDDDIVKEDLDVNLYDTGLLDSLAFVELLFNIEDEIGVIIAPSEIDRSQIDTPRKLITIIKDRL